MSCRINLVLICLLNLSLFAACNKEGKSVPVSPAGIPGVTLPDENVLNPPSSDQTLVPQKNSSCVSSDPNHICLALKYVVYKNSIEQEVLSKADVLRTVNGINQTWAQCNLAFQVDEYLPISPRDYGLRYSPLNDNELTGIRRSFVDSSTLLIVTTGTWNRSGTLGYTGANAWTSMPGESPSGSILERPVGTFSNIIAHELGHYLNLLHVGDAMDLMNPIIYSSSVHLSRNQCSIARNTAVTYWQRMLR